MAQLAENLNDASILLDGYKKLDPANKKDFETYYVKRPVMTSTLIREATAAAINNRPFHWFFTGHTGAGKSTELNRIVANEKLKENYVPLLINISDDFDIHNIDYKDIILAMAKACALKAEQTQCRISKKIRAHILHWGHEVIEEKEVKTLTEGKAGIGVSLPFIKLGEEIKSGGSKREIIRNKIFEDISEFIKLLDDLTDSLAKKTKKRPLCIVDGLDHVDYKPCINLFNDYYVTLTKPKISKLIVIPLAMLNNNQFVSNIAGNYSTVPNIKVYQGPKIRKLDSEGFEFFKNVIARYAKIELFSEGTLESLFELSAGIIRDMIRLAGDACGYGDDDESEKVEMSHVQKVWDTEIQRFRRILQKAEYSILKNIEQTPNPMGLDGIPTLLHLKAVLFYPNGEGWYGIHPAIRRIVEKSD